MNLNGSSSGGQQQTGASGSTPTKPIGSKICRWVQNDGTVCGKAFSKLDSLRRHVNENHKNVRPHACTVCDKNYGRRDYLERHLRTHNKKSLTKAEPGSIDWGPNSGVLMSGDEVTLTPKVPKKKRKDIPAEEKKICLWVLDDGTACGKTFTKFDSLKRHVGEAHKGVRPYCCTLCGKTYGRRDYLLRHLRSHNETEVAGLNIAKVVQPQPTQQAQMVQHVVRRPTRTSQITLVMLAFLNNHLVV
jgi:KRAB domain-containing zinc finger protein